LNADAARLRDFIVEDPGAVLLVEFFGSSIEAVSSATESLSQACKATTGCYHSLEVMDPLLQDRIWKLRRAALGLSMAQKGDAKALSFVEDTAVDPRNLRAYISEFLDIVRQNQTSAGVYAHASVGCLHVRPVINLKTAAGVDQFERIANQVSDLVLRYGGALSGEHGDGLVRSPFQEKMFGPRLYQAFRELKAAFDPHHLLNPGKIVDAPPLTANLRYGPSYLTPRVPTLFDFERDGGFLPAVELCSGVGACRKKGDGTMCPSFQATKAEEHSTRGRANMLRLALTGQLDLDGLTDPDIHAVLDLCLECKACKTECPTNVDMARLKAEALTQYFQKHGIPWRNRAFGNLEAGCRAASLAPILVNFILKSHIVRKVMQRTLGIDRRRSIPAFATQSLLRSWGRIATRAGTSNAPGRRLLLFVDTFTNYFEPEVGQAVILLAGAAGFSVHLAPGKQKRLGQGLCCGRPLISNGMVTRAVEKARGVVEELYPWAENGLPIVGVEPSCILTLRDDYPALLRGHWRNRAEKVAAACLTFEEFFLKITEENGTALQFTYCPKKILVHGHCHQKALVGMEPTMTALACLPGARVASLDAGCCGMAGAFGYESEHYEISRLVGEQRLFPAVRGMSGDDLLVAPGFSCRHQLLHFTGRSAFHPAQVLASLLRTPT
jgi:Fe-S oxidoreductase